MPSDEQIISWLLSFQQVVLFVGLTALVIYCWTFPPPAHEGRAFDEAHDRWHDQNCTMSESLRGEHVSELRFHYVNRTNNAANAAA
ncbi:hypothetical protein M8818_005051 [Zalaria obscura]|uniref:Uncharacterized protein n=1 Tax=Zalaria obscura TaxID=2024903 RepID=A0ACC3SAX4_9PEZI